jgi:hypothetical protein
MKKILASVIAVLIGIAFVTTGFAADEKAPVPPKDQSVTAPAPEKEKPAVKKAAKKKKKAKKAKKAEAKPEKAEPAAPAPAPAK